MADLLQPPSPSREGPALVPACLRAPAQGERARAAACHCCSAGCKPAGCPAVDRGCRTLTDLWQVVVRCCGSLSSCRVTECREDMELKVQISLIQERAGPGQSLDPGTLSRSAM